MTVSNKYSARYSGLFKNGRAITSGKALQILGKTADQIPRQHVTQAREGHGPIYHIEGCILQCLASRVTRGRILEIGANWGVSTRYLMAGRPLIDSVDIRHLWTDDVPGRNAITADSATWEPTADEPYPMAFIDGDHSYDGVTADIRTALNGDAGLLVFHDTSYWISRDNRPGKGSFAFEAATDAFWEDPDVDLLYINTIAGLLLARRRPGPADELYAYEVPSRDHQSVT